MWYCAYFCTSWFGSEFFGTFTRLVVKVCKTVIIVELMVKSGLDPHMIIELKDGFKIAFWLIFVALLSTNHKCTNPCLNAAQKKKKNVLKSRR
jgi:hypothetical protein